MSLLVFIILCFGAAALGSVLTNSSLKTWYPGIKKPSWNPPNKIFPPVWSTLFLLMAIAAWLVWDRFSSGGLCVPLALFGVQLVLNVLWSAIFFGLRNPGLAFLEIIALWAAIVMTTVSFWSVYWLAGVLFLPYLLWVSFAVALNLSVWRLNVKKA